MAKSLQSLIRLNEWKVDQKRRNLGEKLQQMADLEAGLASLENELLAEQNIAQESPQEAGFFYGNYATAVISRREQFESDIAEMTAKISAAQEELNESYRELKKFEIIDKQRQKREAEERDKKEQEILNELGLQNYQRKKTD